MYTKTNEPDPDTGYNFGVERASRKITAWGGTTARDEEDGLRSTRRVWFHDLSAGPDASSGNWNVDDADLDGDDELDYRIPPAWEYRQAGFRNGPTDRRSWEADPVRRAGSAVHHLPALSGRTADERAGKTINLDSNTYEGWPGVDASKYIKPGLVTSELGELFGRQRLSYDNQDLPFTGEAERCYNLLLDRRLLLSGDGLPAFANLFLQNDRELARTQDDRAASTTSCRSSTTRCRRARHRAGICRRQLRRR